MPSVKELLVPTPYPSQLPGENEKWYGRFCAFVALGPGRSVLSAYNAERRERERKAHKKMTLAATIPQSWADNVTGYDWRRRAAEWDALERERNRQLTAERQREQIEREMADSDAMRVKGLDGLGVPLVSAKLADGTVIDGSPAAVRVAADLLKQSAAFRRRALGMAESRVDVHNYDIDMSKLTRRQLERIRDGEDPRTVLAEDDSANTSGSGD